MILRIPDYYREFSCIADRCKDSCCIGWEIDIDEDTYDFYSNNGGSLQDQFDKYMYITEDGDHSFELQKAGRCPFLNSTNLCDICIELGEEALSEVCTEYPRFAIEYGDVLQKCLSLSCEEVGRLVFTRETPVEIIDVKQPDPYEEEWDEYEDEKAAIEKYEKMQSKSFAILQNRGISISERMVEYLNYWMTDDDAGEMTLNKAEAAPLRFEVFSEMEVLNDEWVNARDNLVKCFDDYEQLISDYLESEDYRDRDYEQLMVYFTFRYMMNSVYNFDHKSYAKLAVVFTLVIRDMAAVRFRENGGSFTKEDMIDVARIFSKEVEHSEDNVEMAREAFLFDEVFELSNLIAQIYN